MYCGNARVLNGAVNVIVLVLVFQVLRTHPLYVVNPPPAADGSVMPMYINSPMFRDSSCTVFNQTLPLYVMADTSSACDFSSLEKDVKGTL